MDGAKKPELLLICNALTVSFSVVSAQIQRAVLRFEGFVTCLATVASGSDGEA